MRFVPRSISAQLAAVMIALATVPLFILGTQLIHTSRETVRTSVLRDHEQLAIRAASELGEFMERPRALLTSTAAILGALHADAWKQETALVELVLNHPIFSRIASLDMDGREVASSAPGNRPENYASDTAFITARTGTAVLSDVTIDSNRLPHVTMAVPVRQYGKITGVLRADVNLRGMWNMIDNIRMGETGNAFVIASDGRLIAHPDKKKVLKNETTAFTDSIEAVLSGRTGSLEDFDDAGGAWLCSYAPLADLGWGVVVKQHTRETYAFSRLMQTKSWGFVLLGACFAILLSIVIARRLVRPIRLLIQRTDEISYGHLNGRLPDTRTDEIGSLMRSFNRMTDQLVRARDSEKLAATGKAAAAIAHELKNSLVVTNTLVGLLSKRRHDEAFMNKFIETVPQELKHWKTMLQDMSDFSSPVRYDMVSIEPKDLIENFVGLTREKLNESGAILNIHMDSDLPSVRGNAAKLKQVFMNIMLNAIEAVPKDGMIDIMAQSADLKEEQTRRKFLQITVQDNGNGIPNDALKRVFEPFHTTKPNGLGLGLSISRDIVERHRGHIEITSQPGEGTKITVVLPVWKQPAYKTPSKMIRA